MLWITTPGKRLHDCVSKVVVYVQYMYTCICFLLGVSFVERMDRASKILDSESDFYSLLQSYDINTNPSELIKCLVDEENRRFLCHSATDDNLGMNW